MCDYYKLLPIGIQVCRSVKQMELRVVLARYIACYEEYTRNIAVSSICGFLKDRLLILIIVLKFEAYKQCQIS